MKFEEVQRFRQRWLWAVLLGAVGAAVYFSFLGEGVTAAALVLLLSLPVLLLVYGARLETGIDDDQVTYRFFPFHLGERSLDLDEVSAEVGEYSPLLEFGGWGLRWRPGKLAFSVSGSHGIRIERGGARDIVLGTQKPEEAEEALREA